MSRLYLDACCIIYLIEAANPFHAAVLARLKQHGKDRSARIVTSQLSRLECRVRPLRDKDTGLLARYDKFFSARRLVLAELTPAVIDQATELRAKYGFKTPDAIHLATAIDDGTDVFLTGDTTLQRCAEAKVEIVVP
ncbi:MAG: type II toxin-antitoxin system VapC family toxin [Deltaproteobacteria bacterium]|nr:type II toxin-antitoxin system VapC family toxin [Deltaproteobacteria bacterium]